MRRLFTTVVLGVLLFVPTQFAYARKDQHQGHNPEKGGARMTALIPNQGRHLPSQAWDRGAPHVLENVRKDPRNQNARDALQKPHK